MVFYFTRGVFLNALLAGLSSAIAILPEEFPMVLSVFLALGAWRLSRDRVLTRKPSAIETLGSATVLCTDKTGTITQNRMRVVVAVDKSGREVRSEDTPAYASVEAISAHAFLACPAAPFDAMELAIRETFAPIAADAGWNDAVLVRDYHFSRGAMMTTRVHKRSGGRDLTVSAKGAPEAVLKACALTSAQEVRIRAGRDAGRTTFRRIPCLTVRPNTERPVTVTEGTNEWMTFDVEAMKAMIDRIHAGTFKQGRIPEKWDGHATERVFDALSSIR